MRPPSSIDHRDNGNDPTEHLDAFGQTRYPSVKWNTGTNRNLGGVSILVRSTYRIHEINKNSKVEVAFSPMKTTELTSGFASNRPATSSSAASPYDHAFSKRLTKFH